MTYCGVLFILAVWNENVVIAVRMHDLLRIITVGMNTDVIQDVFYHNKASPQRLLRPTRIAAVLQC